MKNCNHLFFILFLLSLFQTSNATTTSTHSLMKANESSYIVLDKDYYPRAQIDSIIMLQDRNLMDLKSSDMLTQYMVKESRSFSVISLILSIIALFVPIIGIIPLIIGLRQERKREKEDYNFKMSLLTKQKELTEELFVTRERLNDMQQYIEMMQDKTEMQKRKYHLRNDDIINDDSDWRK